MLCAGTKGKRYALPNSEVMIHQILGVPRGRAVTWRSRRSGSAVETAIEHDHRQTHGPAIDVVERACDRDNFMTPDEAKAFGLVDHVVQSRGKFRAERRVQYWPEMPI